MQKIEYVIMLSKGKWHEAVLHQGVEGCRLVHVMQWLHGSISNMLALLAVTQAGRPIINNPSIAARSRIR